MDKTGLAVEAAHNFIEKDGVSAVTRAVGSVNTTGLKARISADFANFAG